MKDCVSCVHEYLSPMSDTCRECGIAMLNYEEAKPKRITNADRIRAMTDEELAEWIERIRMYCANDLCGRGCPLEEVCYSKADTPLETLDWLKQEATNAGT